MKNYENCKKIKFKGQQMKKLDKNSLNLIQLNIKKQK